MRILSIEEDLGCQSVMVEGGLAMIASFLEEPSLAPWHEPSSDWEGVGGNEVNEW